MKTLKPKTRFDNDFSHKELMIFWSKYRSQRDYNKGRKDLNGQPIQFLISFEEWMDIWIRSGKWHLRGSKKGCYHMCRKNDTGDYISDNVFIDKMEHNSGESGKRNRGKLIGFDRTSTYDGRKYFHNPVSGEVKLFLVGEEPDGWVKGIGQRPSAIKGFKWITDGKKVTRIPKHKTIPDGFRTGMV